MTDNILSQEEVDALLKGVDTGDIETEIRPDVSSGEYEKYDFTTQERIVRGRMPGLEMANEKFTRAFRDSMASAIMKFVDVTIDSVGIVTFSDFMKVVPMPSSINIFTMEPLKGYALFVMEAPMVFAMVDYFFGGSSNRPFTKSEGRYFTAIEQRIIRRTTMLALKDMGRAWESLYPIKPEYVSHEMNPQFVNIVTPTEGVIKIEIHVEVEEFTGKMFFCLPYSMVEPVKESLFSGIKGAKFEADQRWIMRFKEMLMSSYAEVDADFGAVELTVSDLMNLEVGNIITLGRAENDEVDVRVQGVPKFRARPGVSKGNNALKITRTIQEA